MGTRPSKYRFDIGDYYLYFPILTPEQNGKRQSEIAAQRKTFGGTTQKGKPRPASSRATKKQWQNPKFRKMQKEKNKKPETWEKMAYMKKPFNADTHSWDKRNEMVKKCIKRAKELGLDIDTRYLKNDELEDLYYRLAQW